MIALFDTRIALESRSPLQHYSTTALQFMIYPGSGTYFRVQIDVFLTTGMIPGMVELMLQGGTDINRI